MSLRLGLLAPSLLLTSCLATQPLSTTSRSDGKNEWQGTFTGVTTCGSRAELAFTISKAQSAGQFTAIEGSLRSTVLEGAAKGKSYEIGMKGNLDVAFGVLYAQSYVEPPNRSLIGAIAERVSRDSTANAAFHLEAVRHVDNQTWRGTIRGPAFDCPDVVLRRGGGRPDSVQLNAISLESADFMIGVVRRDPVPYGTDGLARLYWLRQASLSGDALAIARLGNLYETGDVGVPANKAEAYRHFERAAQLGEARAQDALARYLTEGTAVARDTGAAQQWAAKARVTKNAASRICAAPLAVRAYYALIDAENAAPMTRAAEAVVSGLTGISMDRGTYTIVATKSEAVGLIDRPFRCIAVARRSGASYSSNMPELEYAADDENGNPLYRDNRAEAALNRALAGTMTEALNATPMVATFIVTPLGGTRYRITGRQDIRVTATDFFREVDLGAAIVAPEPSTKLAAPARAPAPAVAPPAATVAPKGSAALATPAGAWDMARVQADLDTEFVAWSRQWSVDRYLRGSAKVGSQDCKQDTCEFKGQFSVNRMGATVPVPFLALIKREGDRYLLGRLCYEDRSSGMRDCAR